MLDFRSLVQNPIPNLLFPVRLKKPAVSDLNPGSNPPSAILDCRGRRFGRLVQACYGYLGYLIDKTAKVGVEKDTSLTPEDGHIQP